MHYLCFRSQILVWLKSLTAYFASFPGRCIMQESANLRSFYDTVEQATSNIKTTRKGAEYPRHRTQSRGAKLRWRQVNAIRTDTENCEVSNKVVSQFELYKQSRAELQRQEAEN